MQNDSDLSYQLEFLKDRLKNREKDISEILKTQKKEYEKNTKLKDEEVSIFVDGLVKENWELKKTIISLEIDIESYKEKLFNQMTDNFDDKLFYDNIKHIKEQNEIKEKEILAKYDRMNKNLIKETKQLLITIRKSAFENKHKILNDDGKEEDYEKSENSTVITLTSVQEHFNIFENKIKLLYEECKNKEKYSLVIEQKYEMIIEENKMIKKKLKEEKMNILKMIEDIQSENSMTHNQMMNKIQSEIQEKKINLEKDIKISLNRSEEVVNELIREKNRINEELKTTNERLIISEGELMRVLKEKEDLRSIYNSKINEMNNFDNLKKEMDFKVSELKIEKTILEKSTSDLTEKLNEILIRSNSFQIENKILNETLTRELEKLENKNKSLTEIFNNEIAALNMQIKEYKNKLEEENQNAKIIIKIRKDISDLENKVEFNKEEISKKQTDLKITQNIYNDIKSLYDNLLKKFNNLEDELKSKLSDMKLTKENLAEREIELNSIKKEMSRISKVKDDYFFNFEEAKKTNVYITNQLETFKISSEIESQRLKYQNMELEKLTEKSAKSNMVDYTNNSELKNENRELKNSISRLFKTYMSKLNSYNDLSSNSNYNFQQDELQMINDIETGFDKLISLITNKAYKQNTDNLADERIIQKYKDEISNLKNKLSTVMKITNSVGKSNQNSNNNSASNSNTAFKGAEKENSNSLYESVIVHIKNTNLKHLLEIFQLNISREEELRGLLTDKNNPNNMNNMKKTIGDLNNNFSALKNLCEGVFEEYQQRAKNYIQPEEFEKRLEEYKIFTQSLLDMVLDTLMNYKMEVKDAIVFKMPINDYNHFIENISLNLENFNSKVNMQIESYNKLGVKVDKALDALIQSTTVDYDILSNLMSEKFI